MTIRAAPLLTDPDDVVPPDHPSHLWPTAEERDTDPMREGCGKCGCLPSGYESREPCPGPAAPMASKPPVE